MPENHPLGIRSQPPGGGTQGVLIAVQSQQPCALPEDALRVAAASDRPIYELPSGLGLEPFQDRLVKNRHVLHRTGVCLRGSHHGPADPRRYSGTTTRPRLSSEASEAPPKSSRKIDRFEGLVKLSEWAFCSRI